MCAISVIGDYFGKRVPEIYPWVNTNPLPWVNTNPLTIYTGDGPTKEEFNALKKEINELKKLLKAAKRYDAKTSQPDCKLEEKIALIRKIADLVGVELGDCLS